jgi:hypothetical protein
MADLSLRAPVHRDTRLRALREASGRTLESVAAELDRPAFTVGIWERGGEIPDDAVDQVAHMFGVKPGHLARRGALMAAAEPLRVREGRAMLTLAEVMQFMADELQFHADELGDESGFGDQLSELAPHVRERGRGRLRDEQAAYGRPELAVVD